MMTTNEIAVSFSNGEFDKTYDYIAQESVWEIINDRRIKGKVAIVEYCTQVAKYFETVTTNFTTLNVITENNKVAINGTGEFKKNDKRVSFVSSCDVYEFSDNNKIIKITSYCITAKEI